MSFVIAINENEFVSIYGNKIKSGAERQEHFEVHTVKIPVNLGEATIYEDYSEAQDILEQIKHRKKYITMYGWTCYKEHELHKIVDKLYIAFVITGEITDTVFNVITEIDKKYYKRLKDYEHFKERYDVIFRSANPESPFETLPQYALDRDDFIRIYGNISEALMNESWYETSDFAGNKITTIESGSTGNKTLYKVTNTYVVDQSDFSCLNQDTNGKIELTLITCIKYQKKTKLKEMWS